jgi:hypothetical protein
MYQLKITIDGITPPIWRTIQVPETYSLNRLHHIIQISLGWTNSHIYCFGNDNVHITDPLLWAGGTTMWDKKVKIKDVLQKEGDSLSYEYDFGDSWKHTIVLEKIEDGGSNSIRCLDGAKDAPPEDYGGIRGYQELLHHVKHPEKDGYLELLEWLDDDYNPEIFDLKGVNKGLRGLARYIRMFEEENGLNL